MYALIFCYNKLTREAWQRLFEIVLLWNMEYTNSRVREGNYVKSFLVNGGLYGGKEQVAYL